MRVLTLTANLLAETTYTFETWQEGATQRASAESFQVGGKGINVTHMLARFGLDSVAVCFPGGATGERCLAWLRGRGIPHQPFPTPAETRTGAAVRATGRAETTFLGTDNHIDPAAIAACASWLHAHAGEDLLALCGSIPAWQDARWDALRAEFEHIAAQGRLIVDTYGPPLAWLAHLPARLVKINRREFAGLLGLPYAAMTDEAMPDLLAGAFASHRARGWVVTDGPHRVWISDGPDYVASLVPPAVAEVSPTGSGDVLMAGMLYALQVRQVSLEEAVRFALPLAAANAASPGVADFDLTPFGIEDRLR